MVIVSPANPEVTFAVTVPVLPTPFRLSTVGLVVTWQTGLFSEQFAVDPPPEPTQSHVHFQGDVVPSTWLALVPALHP
jgi:hypothetical protein